MNLNLLTVQDHMQIAAGSCIPMSVECVLKLNGLMAAYDFSLQQDPQKHGTSDWVKGFLYPATGIAKIQFEREYLLKDLGISPDRGQHFMATFFNPLFNTIDSELAADRFVIVSLESGQNTWHMEVVYNKIDHSTYETITFYDGSLRCALYRIDLRQRVSNMQGTDILTYKFI